MTKRILYEVLVRVSEEKLPSILSVLTGEVTLLSIKPLFDETSVRTSPRATRAFHYANGKHDKGIIGPHLVVKMLATGRPFTQATLEPAFKSNGFAPSSAGPSVHRAIADGLVKKDQRGGTLSLTVAGRELSKTLRKDKEESAS
jgi:hypothetical protein